MEKMIIMFFRILRRSVKWVSKKNKFMGYRAFYVFLGSLLVTLVLAYFFQKKQNIIFSIFFIIFYSLGFLFGLSPNDSPKKYIIRFSKGKYCNNYEILSTMSHMSYLYGMTKFLFTELIFMGVLIVFCLSMIFDNYSLLNLLNYNIVAINMVILTFFYFTYHMYINPQHITLEKIEQTLHLYTAIGTSINFIIMLSDKINLSTIKISVSGILLMYLWLEYIIIKKKNESI